MQHRPPNGRPGDLPAGLLPIRPSHSRICSAGVLTAVRTGTGHAPAAPPFQPSVYPALLPSPGDAPTAPACDGDPVDVSQLPPLPLPPPPAYGGYPTIAAPPPAPFAPGPVPRAAHPVVYRAGLFWHDGGRARAMRRGPAPPNLDAVVDWSRYVAGADIAEVSEGPSRSPLCSIASPTGALGRSAPLRGAPLPPGIPRTASSPMRTTWAPKAPTTAPGAAAGAECQWAGCEASGSTPAMGGQAEEVHATPQALPTPECTTAAALEQKSRGEEERRVGPVSHR